MADLPAASQESQPARTGNFFLDDVRGELTWGAWLAPGILAFLLALPCLRFTYMLDDYLFLNNAVHMSLRDYLPNIGDVFYRPISRGLYFTILSMAGDSGALLGHWINILVLALVAALVGGAGARLGGRRIGILSGTLFASLACAPMLVAWVSCSQDLLAMLFVMLALHLRLSNQRAAALLCVAMAVLSKETAFAAVPALLLLDRVRGRPNTGWKRETTAYVLFAGAWVAVHPAARAIFGATSGATGYVGVPAPLEAVKQAGIYALEVCNLRLGKFTPAWTPWEMASIFAAVALGIAWLWRVLGKSQRSGSTPRQVVAIGTLLAVGPWLLSSLALLHWSPYYAAFPALGSSLAFGALIARLPRSACVALMTLFMLSGIASRASNSETAVLTENDLRISSDAHRTFERNLLKVLPSVPPASQLLFSLQVRGRASVYHQVHDYKMPRIWYRDPSLIIRRPEERAATSSPEFLIAVSKDLDVVRIDPVRFTAVSASGRVPDYVTVEQALRTYAVGAASSGRTDDGARLLIEMPDIDLGFKMLHHRMAVMVLLAAGRQIDAQRLGADIPPVTRKWAMETLPAVLAQQPPDGPFDAAGLRAFGIDTTDVGAIRGLTRVYLIRRFPVPAGRFANRLLALAAHDSVGLAAIVMSDSALVAQAHER